MKLALYLPNFRDEVTLKELEDLTGLAEELDSTPPGRSLAGEGSHGGVVQADVTDGQIGEFLDPGRGVVEAGRQGRVASACGGGSVGYGE